MDVGERLFAIYDLFEFEGTEQIQQLVTLTRRFWPAHPL